MTYLLCAAGHAYEGWCRPCNAAAVRRYRARRLGVPVSNRTKKGPEPRPVFDRMLGRIDASGDCWEWTGGMTPSGYGVVDAGSHRSRGAHRVLYELLVGPIPDGLQLDHLCRNRRCVNPDHLEPVTVRENVLRSPIGAGARAQRTHCPAGHPYSPDNTILSRRNQRHCRTCSRDRVRAHREALRCTG